MIRFLIKGILRDRSRSLLPVIIVSIGVMLTVVLSGYMSGSFGDVVDQNARFETGHLKVMSKAYAQNKDQIPNDLALLEADELMEKLKADYPDMDWVNRIKFVGLIDVPDANGETKTQGPAAGVALDLLGANSTEIKRMNIKASLMDGSIPQQKDEALLGYKFAQKLGIKVGESFTFFGQTMDGSMSLSTFKVAGTIRFGSFGMDQSAIIIDLNIAKEMLDMEDAAGEILGFSNSGVYQHENMKSHADNFNLQYAKDEDEYAPVMLPLKAQNNLAGLLDFADRLMGIFIFTFILAMAVVLWNTGLLGGLRRYKEFGIRLALGEPKRAIYISLVIEAIIVGIIGSILGTLLGLAVTYYMQVVGFDISQYVEETTMVMPTIIRSKFTMSLLYIGFIPGVLAMVFGTMLAGLGIYKRETAHLFKELEI